MTPVSAEAALAGASLHQIVARYERGEPFNRTRVTSE
jgi:hypothetical protein